VSTALKVLDRKFACHDPVGTVWASGVAVLAKNGSKQAKTAISF